MNTQEQNEIVEELREIKQWLKMGLRVIVIALGIIVGCLLTGCVNISYTDPAGNQLEINSFLKDIEADKLSYSVMDANGNGKTFDLSKYRGEVSPVTINAANVELQAGKGE